MRVLIDACVDPRILEAFHGHQVKTAFELGWHVQRDHVLLALAQCRFDVLVTIDRGFEHQHNLSKLTFGILIIHVPKNKVEFYRPIFEELRRAVEAIAPGEVVHVHSPELTRRRK